MKSLILFIVAVIFASQVAMAQSALPVTIRMQNGTVNELTLLERLDRSLRLQSRSGGGEVVLSLKDIAEVRFIFPATMNQAQQAYAAGQWEKAAAITQPIAMSLLPYLDLPNNNGVALVVAVADTLRRANRLNEALNLFDKLRLLPKTPQTSRATVWTAYCMAGLGKLEAAQKLLDANPVKPDNENYALDRMVRSRIHLVQKDYRTAVDEVAQVIASSRIDSDWFPESLFISAECYSALSTTNLIQSSITNDFAKVSQGIYLEITKNFPNTTWAKQSKSKLSETAAGKGTNSTDRIETQNKDLK